MKRDAIFSEDREHRYKLQRVLDGDFRDRTLAFVMLNPSTADESEDDPATRKCLEIAREHDYKQVEIVNLFSVVNSTAAEISDCEEPVRVENDEYIINTCEKADKIVCGWGDDGQYMDRATEVYNRISHLDLECLRINASGEPTYIRPNGPLQHRMDNETQTYDRVSRNGA